MRLTDKIVSIIKNKEIIVYLFVGILTTIINFIVFKIADVTLGDNMYLLANLIAWIISVAFAFITNKYWVFKSKSFDSKIVLKECIGFVSGRVFSLVIEQVFMYLLIDLAGFGSKYLNLFNIIDIDGKTLVKMFLLGLVIILNYIFSKLFVFKKR